MMLIGDVVHVDLEVDKVVVDVDDILLAIIHHRLTT